MIKERGKAFFFSHLPHIQKESYTLSEALLKEVRNLIPKIEKARLYRGRGGEYMRASCCRIIRAIAQSEHPMTERLVCTRQTKKLFLSFFLKSTRI